MARLTTARTSGQTGQMSAVSGPGQADKADTPTGGVSVCPAFPVLRGALGPVLGIDPGVSGAIAVVAPTGDLIDVFDMPILHDGSKGRSAVNAPLLASIIGETGATTAFVEFVGARPGEGAVGAFSFGRCRGVIEGVAAGLGIPVAFITPPSWKRAVGIPPGKDGAKDAARSEAIRRWPSLASKFARVKDDGRAEAALIALAGIKKQNSGVP